MDAEGKGLVFFIFSRRLMKSCVFAICLENRLTALEPIIFCVSVFRFGAGKEGAFFVSSRSWAFFEAPETIFKECMC